MDADTNARKEAEVILTQHGPRGHFVKVLYRFRMLGWVLFALLLAFVLLRYTLAGLIPAPVQVVNDRGEIIGQIDYYNTLQRVPDQYITAGMAFLNYKLSLTSSTIFQDSNHALVMMAPALREKELAKLTTDVDPSTKKPVLLAIEEQKTRSWLEFANGADAARVVATKDGTTTVRYKGQLSVVGARRVDRPFDITVEMRAVARNAMNPIGIEVEAYNDN